MRNAVAEIKKALGVDEESTSFIGVVSVVDGNGSVTVIAGDREQIVRADRHLGVGDEVIVENGVIVGLAEEVEMVVWI